MGFAREVADRVIFMDDGIVAAQGAPDEIFSGNPNKRLTDFLGKVL